jgi:hypothetical protein
MVNDHLLFPRLVNVIPLAVGVFALYPVFGVHVIVTVVPGVALLALALALPPVPALTLTLYVS